MKKHWETALGLLATLLRIILKCYDKRNEKP